jgi:hypothetical protein
MFVIPIGVDNDGVQTIEVSEVSGDDELIAQGLPLKVTFNPLKPNNPTAKDDPEIVIGETIG